MSLRRRPAARAVPEQSHAFAELLQHAGPVVHVDHSAHRAASTSNMWKNWHTAKYLEEVVKDVLKNAGAGSGGDSGGVSTAQKRRNAQQLRDVEKLKKKTADNAKGIDVLNGDIAENTRSIEKEEESRRAMGTGIVEYAKRLDDAAKAKFSELKGDIEKQKSDVAENEMRITRNKDELHDLGSRINVAEGLNTEAYKKLDDSVEYLRNKSTVDNNYLVKELEERLRSLEKQDAITTEQLKDLVDKLKQYNDTLASVQEGRSGGEDSDEPDWLALAGNTLKATEQTDEEVRQEMRKEMRKEMEKVTGDMDRLLQSSDDRLKKTEEQVRQEMEKVTDLAKYLKKEIQKTGESLQARATSVEYDVVKFQEAFDAAQKLLGEILEDVKSVMNTISNDGGNGEVGSEDGGNGEVGSEDDGESESDSEFGGEVKSSQDYEKWQRPKEDTKVDFTDTLQVIMREMRIVDDLLEFIKGTSNITWTKSNEKDEGINSDGDGQSVPDGPASPPSPPPPSPPPPSPPPPLLSETLTLPPLPEGVPRGRRVAVPVTPQL